MAQGIELLDRPNTKKPRRSHGRNDPPKNSDGGGGGGGRGDGSGGNNEGDAFPLEKGKLGLLILIFSVSLLFIMFLISYAMIRRSATQWPPPGCPAPPSGLWGSTLILLSSSLTMHFAVMAYRRGHWKNLQGNLLLTLGLGALFLITQVYLWSEMLAVGLTFSSNAYGAIFYSVTGLHGLHIAGGLFFISFVLRRVMQNQDASVDLCAIYWHFMSTLWLALFVVLYFTNG